MGILGEIVETCLIGFKPEGEAVSLDEAKGIYALLKERRDVTMVAKHRYIVTHDACLRLDEMNVKYEHIKEL